MRPRNTKKKNTVDTKDFNIFMCNQSLHRERKHFCCYCLQAFSTEEILKCHTNDCFKLNGKQKIKMTTKGEYVRFKNYERNIIKSPFMIYTDFENILVSENNKKQNPNKSYTKKCQKHIACSFGYKLVCVHDAFSKPF